MLRFGLAVFVLVWLFAPSTLQSVVPVWLAFLLPSTPEHPRAAAGRARCDTPVHPLARA
jgi:hypothetical protein